MERRAFIPVLDLDIILDSMAVARKPPPVLPNDAWDEKTQLSTACAPRSPDGQRGLYVEALRLVRDLPNHYSKQLEGLPVDTWVRVDFGPALTEPAAPFYGTIKVRADTHRAFEAALKLYKGDVDAFILSLLEDRVNSNMGHLSASERWERLKRTLDENLADDDSITPGRVGKDYDDDIPSVTNATTRSEREFLAGVRREFARELKETLADAVAALRTRPARRKKK